MELDALDQIGARAFDGYLVRKDLVRDFSRQYPVPTYVVEFLLGRYLRQHRRGRDPGRARHRPAAAGQEDRPGRRGRSCSKRGRGRRARSGSST
jgi:hypothetical protein